MNVWKALEEKQGHKDLALWIFLNAPAAQFSLLDNDEILKHPFKPFNLMNSDTKLQVELRMKNKN